MNKLSYRKWLMSGIGLIMLIIILISGAKTMLPVKALDTIDLFKNFTSGSVLLMHPDSGTILYAKNENEKLPVASITKLMTTLIALEKIEKGELSLEDEVTASSYAASMEGSQAFLDAGSNYKVKDLLKSVIVASANDSAVAIAEAIAGSEEAFVTMMNDKAKSLNMENTLYGNSTGLEGVEQYSTALDTAKVLKAVGKYDIFNEDSKIWMDDFVHPSGRKTELVNTNRLIRYYDKTINGKTGFTDEAKYCLATTAMHKDMKLIAVTLKSNSVSNRFKENMELFNYGFANYENRQVLSVNQCLDKSIKVNGGKTASVKLSPQEDYYVVTKKGDKGEVKVVLEIKDNINAPVKMGEIVGKCLIVKEGKVIGEVNVVTMENVERQSYNDVIDKIIYGWSIAR